MSDEPTIEQKLKNIIGDLIFQLAALQVELDKYKKMIAEKDK
jgi:hypothetical protein